MVIWGMRLMSIDEISDNEISFIISYKILSRLIYWEGGVKFFIS